MANMIVRFCARVGSIATGVGSVSLLALVALSGVTACDSGSNPPSQDTVNDASGDAPTDALTDAPSDALTSDSGAQDAPTSATNDAIAPDTDGGAGDDTGASDTGAAVGPDAAPDATPDATPDAVADSGSAIDSGDSGLGDGGPGSGSSDSGSGMTATDASDAAAAAPIASFSTSTLMLPAGNCGGAPVSTTYSISNTGTATLNVTHVAVTGNVFAVTPTSLSIQAGQSGMLTVSATVPQNSTAGAALSTNLTFNTNDTSHAAASLTASVIPTGVTLAWAPASGGNPASPTSASFGVQPQGVVASPITLTLQNTGNASAVVGIGSVSAPFSLSPSTGTLAPMGGTVALTAGFDPMDTQQHGPVNASFSLPNGTAVCGTSLTSVALSGQGGTGVVSGWPSSSYDFGATPCNSAPSQAFSFTLGNTGSVPVHITAVQAGGATTYTTDATTSSVVPANGSLVVNVYGPAIPQYPASLPASYGGTIAYTTDAYGDTSPHVVTLTEEASGAILSFDTLQNNNFGNFGPQAAPSTNPVAFNVVNTGNAPSTVTLGVANDNTPGAFSVSTPSFTVSNGTPQAENAIFAPPVYGPFTGSLTVASATNLCAPLPGSLSLSGAGNAGTIAVSPASLSFAASCNTTAASQTFTVSNNGDEPINWSASLSAGVGSVYTVSVSGANGALTTNSYTVENASLGAGLTDTITVQPLMIPQYPANTNPSAFADTITVTSNVPSDSPHTIALSEIPLGDVIQWTATGFTFGNQPVSTNATAQTFTITNAANQGSPSANITITPSDAVDFSLSSTSATIAAGATSSPIGVDFDAPATAGPYPETLTLSTSDTLCAQLPSAVTASGTAVVAGPQYSATSLAFGNVNCGATASPQTISVSNTGGNPFTITNLALTAGTYFSVSMTPSSGLVPAYSSNAVVITVTPNPIPATVASVPDTAAFSDTLLITTTADNGTPNQSIPLSMGAQGVIIANGLVSTNWNFGSVVYGSTGNYNIPIDNTGNAAAVASLSLTSTSYFGLASPTIPADTNGVLTATFTPPNLSGSFPDQGTLTIAPANGQVFCEPLPGSWNSPTINLSGTETNGSFISVSPTSLPFPAATCGGTPPAGESVSIFNSGGSIASYTATLANGAFYTLTGATGTVPAGGSTPIQVTPGNQLNLAQNGGGDIGSAPYSDTLEVQVTAGATTIYYVPITMTVDGVVLALNGGSSQPTYGYNTSCSSSNSYQAQAYGGMGGGAEIQNTGNVAGTVSATFPASSAGQQTWADVYFQTPPAQNINAGSVYTFPVTLQQSPPGCGNAQIGNSFSWSVPGTMQFSSPNMCAPPLVISVASWDDFGF